MIIGKKRNTHGISEKTSGLVLTKAKTIEYVMIRKIISRIININPDAGFTKLCLNYKFKKLRERRFGRF